MKDRTPVERWHPRRLAAGLLIFLLFGIVSPLIYRPPAPLPADAPPDRFSAARAMPFLEELVGDGIPHPAGSVQNAVVRERLIEAFRSLGYEPVVQVATLTTRRGEFTVRNVMARLRGTSSSRAVMLAAHYDSTPWGPGASDDGVAVAAVLEIARMLGAERPPPNDVIFLITDGEELGMLGARAFVNEHPWAQDIAVVVNLEARGTRGPSLMFETSAEDAWLAEIAGRVVRRPFTSSLFSAVYRRMPNDTDFSIFKRAGIEGFNFAFIGGAGGYHTPGDDLRNVDPGSFQHHGENALALVRELAGRDLTRSHPGKAVYFDLFGRKVIRWPRSWSLPTALILLLLAVALTLVLHRAGAVSLRGLARASALWPVVLVGAFLLGWGFDRFLGAAGIIGGRWVRFPIPAVAAFWLLAALWTVGAVRTAATRPGRSNTWEAWCAVWLWWGVLDVGLAAALPGASYLTLVPMLLAVAGGLAVVIRGTTHAGPAAGWAALLPLVAVAALWLGMEPPLYDALGLGANPALAGRAALALSTLIPLVS